MEIQSPGTNVERHSRSIKWNKRHRAYYLSCKNKNKTHYAFEAPKAPPWKLNSKTWGGGQTPRAGPREGSGQYQQSSGRDASPSAAQVSVLKFWGQYEDSGSMQGGVTELIPPLKWKRTGGGEQEGSSPSKSQQPRPGLSQRSVWRRVGHRGECQRLRGSLPTPTSPWLWTAASKEDLCFFQLHLLPRRGS